jgi:hypothetical protein
MTLGSGDVDRLGLNHDDLRTYQKALGYTHERRIEVRILDLDMNHLRSLTPVVVDGQVTIDVSADVSRILTLSFLDPNRALAFEPDTPGPALWRNRLIRVIYSVRVPELGDWVDCPVFTGPVWDFNRQGALVNITAHGMERLALGQAWSAKHYAKGKLRTDAIKDIMSRYAGDNCHAVPDLDYKLPKEFTVAKMSTPWSKAQHLAHSMNRYLFYDGRGTLHLRHHNDRPLFTFDSELLTQPSFARSREPIINTVEVIGAKPKGKKRRVRAVAVAKGWMSPSTLGRSGAQLRLVQQIQNDHLRSHKEAQDVADRRIKHHMQQRVDITFDSLPVPHLEEHDRVRVGSTDVGPVALRMHTWTIPLGSNEGQGAAMTVGSKRRTTSPRMRSHGIA